MAKNIYQQRDDVVQGMVDSAVKNLKNGTGQPLPRGTNNSVGITSTPSHIPPMPPSRIAPVSAWPKRMSIPTPQ